MSNLNNIIFCGIYSEKHQNLYLKNRQFLIKNDISPDNIQYLKISKDYFSNYLKKDNKNSSDKICDDYKFFFENGNNLRINHMIELIKKNPNKLIIYHDCNYIYHESLPEFIQKINQMLNTCDFIFEAEKKKKKKNSLWKSNINLSVCIFKANHKIFKCLNDVNHKILNTKKYDQKIFNNMIYFNELSVSFILLNPKNIYLTKYTDISNNSS